jgi:hypothetical protein
MMISIVDNAVPKSLQKYLQDIFLTHNGIPWFYIDDIAGINAEVQTEGWAHVFKDSNTNSPMTDIMMAILFIATEQANVPVHSVERIRAGLFTIKESQRIHNPHIDWDSEHLVMLYYVIDSDGPTYFYNDKNEIIKQVDPVAGRAVIFDGRIKHASSSPTSYKKRIVINFNFNTKK